MVVLVRTGRSAYQISLDGQAGETERFAARELRKYVQKVSGVKLPITTWPRPAPRTKNIHLLSLEGKEGKRHAASFQGKRIQSLLHKVEGCKLESFGFTVSGSDIFLVGRDPRGLLNGVYAFLEKLLGIRWLDMDRGGEIIPQKKTIAIAPAELVEEPAFALRGIGDGCCIEYSVADLDWMSNNRLNLIVAGIPYWEKVRERQLPEIRKRGMLLYVGGHFAHNYFPDPKRYFNRHPEYYALIDGKRAPGQICYSNTEACRIHMDNLLHYVHNHPEIDIFGPWANDGISFCECRKCRRIGTNRLLLDFYNRFAAAVSKVNPKMLVEYGYYLETMLPLPQDIQLHENLLLMYAPYSNSNRYEAIFDARGGNPVLKERSNQKACADLHQLLEATPNVIVLSYYSDQIMKTCNYSPFPAIIRDDFVYYQEAGVAGFHDVQVNRNIWWMDSLNIYVYLKMLWDPHQPLQPILDDYYQGMYGPAAEMVAQFDRAMFELATTMLYHGYRVNDALPLYFGNFAKLMASGFRPGLERATEEKVADKLDAASQLLDRAQKLASKGDRRIARRIQRLRLCLTNFEHRFRAGYQNVKVAYAFAQLEKAGKKERPARLREAKKAMADARRLQRDLQAFARRMSRATRTPMMHRIVSSSQNNLAAHKSKLQEILGTKGVASGSRP